MRVGVHRLHDARVTEQGLHYLRRVLASVEEGRAECVAQAVERKPLLREPRERPTYGFLRSLAWAR